MGISAKSKNSKESWGMGLLLVFFPEDNNNNNNNNSTAINVKKNNTNKNNKLFSSSSSSSSMSRSNSNRLLSKAQSTISICALLVFITLLLFTLSTFEPNNRHSHGRQILAANSRRFLTEHGEFRRNSKRDSDFSFSNWYFPKMWRKRKPKSEFGSVSRPQTALQGLGTLYRRGTRAMADLALAHVAEDVSDDELRLFLRALHRSGVTARADVVLVFASSSSKFDSVIRDESESFSELVRRHKTTSSSKNLKTSPLSFDLAQFKAGKKEAGEPLWGKRTRSGFANNSDEFTDSTQKLSYGSVVGFEVSELDPENSLSGFLDHVPMSLRRWACYPMLLGRVRRHFKHITLVDVKSLILLGDQLGLVRNRSPESVHFFAKSESSNSKHGRRNSDKTQSHYAVNSAVITGGARGIRRLSSAMLTEIVRAATAAQQHKRRSPVTEAGILNQLIGNEFLLKNVEVIKSADSVPEVSELGRKPASFSGQTVVQRGNSNGHDFKSLVMKRICSSEFDSSVYSDCLVKS